MPSESLQCYTEFRFTRQALPRSPQFVGPYQRLESMCEDVSFENFQINELIYIYNV